MCGESAGKMPLCGFGDYTPIFFFETSKKITPCRWKRKMSGMSWPAKGQLTNEVRRHELPCSPGVLLSAALKVSK